MARRALPLVIAGVVAVGLVVGVRGRRRPGRAAHPCGPGRLFRAERHRVDGEGGAEFVASLESSAVHYGDTTITLRTDGVNEYPPDNDLDALLADLGTEDERSRVRVFPIAYGADADLEVLGRIARATTAVAYDAGDPTSIDKVLRDVVSNF
jgi:hypothetical protein